MSIATTYRLDSIVCEKKWNYTDHLNSNCLCYYDYYLQQKSRFKQIIQKAIQGTGLSYMNLSTEWKDHQVRDHWEQR